MTGASCLRILIVGLNYAPEQVGIGPYTTGLAEALARMGHQVEVVAGQAYYPQWQRHPGQPRNGARTTSGGVGITRVWHYIPKDPSGIRRILHHASFACSALPAAIRAARRTRPDIVFTVAPSLFSVPVAWLTAHLLGAKLWLHIQDFEVEASFATGLLDRSSLTARLALWFEHAVIGLADRISTISPPMIALLRGKGYSPEKTFELRNWANAGFAPDPAEAERMRAEWNVGSRHVALYSGNIANKQGIELIVDAARRLSHRKDLLFIICGQGPNRKRLRELASGLDNIQFHDLQPVERMGGLLAMADVHLLPQIPGVADLVLPSKLTNMLLSGRPVVATAADGTGLAAEVHGCGVVTQPGDAGSFADAIAMLLDDPELRGKMGEQAVVRARDRWEQGAIMARLDAEFMRLAGQDQAALAHAALEPDPV